MNMSKWVDFRRGAGLRVNYDGSVLVLRNEKDTGKPWTVIHMNGAHLDDYYVGLTLTDKHVKDWPKLTYLMS
jgi:hypothetical protein